MFHDETILQFSMILYIDEFKNYSTKLFCLSIDQRSKMLEFVQMFIFFQNLIWWKKQNVWADTIIIINIVIIIIIYYYDSSSSSYVIYNECIKQEYKVLSIKRQN